MKEKILPVLSYLTEINGLIADINSCNDIDKLLANYCNNHTCRNCALAFNDHRCIPQFIRYTYISYKKNHGGVRYGF